MWIDSRYNMYPTYFHLRAVVKLASLLNVIQRSSVEELRQHLVQKRALFFLSFRQFLYIGLGFMNKKMVQMYSTGTTPSLLCQRQVYGLLDALFKELKDCCSFLGYSFSLFSVCFNYV